MPQEFQQPRKQRRASDSTSQDSGSWQPAPTRPNRVSESAGNTLSDIDSLLKPREENHPASSATSNRIPSPSPSSLAGREANPISPVSSPLNNDTAVPGKANPTSPISLKQQEETGKKKKLKPQPPDRSQFSALDHASERLGQGYTGKGSQKSRTLSKLYNSKSGTNKKLAIAGAIAGSSLIATAIAFVLLLPLKIESITSLYGGHFDSAETAVGDESQSVFNQYVAKHILPALGAKQCHSTIDTTCVFPKSGDGPFGKLYTAWHDQRIEYKLATQYKIIFGAQGSGIHRQLYMNIDGQIVSNNSELNAILNDPAHHSIFDITNSTGSGRATTAEAREAIRNAFGKITLNRETYLRYQVLSLMSRKHGVPLCFMACTTRDNIRGSINDKKLAVKGWFVRNVLGSLSQNYSLIMQCVLTGPQFCSDSLDPAKAGDSESLTPIQQKVQSQVLDYAAANGPEALADLIKQADAIGKDGLQKYIARVATAKLVSIVAGDTAGDAAGDAATKVVPVVGWALLIGQLASVAQTLGPALQHISYEADKAASIQTYTGYQVVASELKSGNADTTEVGSFTQGISTNIDPDSSNQSDVTDTPLYNSIANGTTATASTASLTNIFSGIGYADTTTTDSRYKCDDGKPVPAGQLQCNEENFNRGNDALNALSTTVGDIPGLSILTGVVKVINSVIGTAFTATCNITPGCKPALQSLSGLATPLLAWVQNSLVSTPFDNTSGGRTGDMMAAGADASNGDSCQDNLGCKKLTGTEAAAQFNQQAADAKIAFNSTSMFARMFSTSTPYSLVSRMAMAMPTSMTGVSTSLATIITNPLRTMNTAFSSLFSGNHAFAAMSTAPEISGLPNLGYTSVPSDPEGFWDANCVNGPMAIYDESSDTLDISAWLNNDPSTEVDGQPNTKQDTTGEQIYLKTNDCKLILASVQDSGAMFDSSFVSQFANSDTGEASGGSNTATSGTAPSYCTDGSASGSEKIVCSAFLYDDYDYSTPGHRDTGSKLKSFIADVRKCVTGNFGTGCAYSKFTPLLDCSGLVDASIYDATGIDLGGIATGSYPGNSHLEPISINDAQPGDIAWWDSPDGHTEVITGYDKSTHVLSTFGAHSPNRANDRQISTDTYPEDGFPLPQKVFRVVGGS